MYHLWPSTSTVQVCCDVMRMTAVVTYTGKKGYLPVSADLIWSVSAWQWFHSSKTSNQKGIQVTPWSYFSLLGLGSPHRAAYTASFQYKKYENRRATSIVSRGGGNKCKYRSCFPFPFLVILMFFFIFDDISSHFLPVEPSKLLTNTALENSCKIKAIKQETKFKADQGWRQKLFSTKRERERLRWMLWSLLLLVRVWLYLRNSHAPSLVQ